MSGFSSSNSSSSSFLLSVDDPSSPAALAFFSSELLSLSYLSCFTSSSLEMKPSRFECISLMISDILVSLPSPVSKPSYSKINYWMRCLAYKMLIFPLASCSKFSNTLSTFFPILWVLALSLFSGTATAPTSRLRTSLTTGPILRLDLSTREIDCSRKFFGISFTGEESRTIEMS